MAQFRFSQLANRVVPTAAHKISEVRRIKLCRAFRSTDCSRKGRSRYAAGSRRPPHPRIHPQGFRHRDPHQHRQNSSYPRGIRPPEPWRVAAWCRWKDSPPPPRRYQMRKARHGQVRSVRP
uniref:Uncharacterized protein n=1 Tax=Steinernema glaseri TaxID=37863 RepID=A0A1I8AGH6_9BILA